MGVNYNTSIVTSGLQLCLDAANTKSYPGSGTTWTDLSGNSNNGTLTGSPTFNSGNGGYISFNGTSDYVSIGDRFATAAGTIACWITVNGNITSSNNLNYRICGKSTDYEFRFLNTVSDGAGQSYGSVGADLGGSASVVSATRSWTANTWYYVAVTWNTATPTSSIYVQGVLDGTGTSTNITAQVGNFDIGRSGTRGYLAGRISLFTVYNRALTAAEISQNFNATRGRYGV